MKYRWFPWKFIVKHMARRHGFLDPVSIMAQMQRFAQPSEVGEPVELLRAGMVFHARGLMNVRAIQHNLDWVWPYWVERQFDPGDESFIPRAFSFSHINLTHRNWTAVGVPDCAVLPVIDPRGLVTPFLDGWSHDGWIVGEKEMLLLPSKLKSVNQEWVLEPTVKVATRARAEDALLEAETELVLVAGEPVCRTVYSVEAGPGPRRRWLAVAIRPYNPEGVAFIHSLRFRENRTELVVNEEQLIRFDRPAEKIVFSHYHDGDIAHHLLEREENDIEECRVGMATAAALFPLDEEGWGHVEVTVALSGDPEFARGPSRDSVRSHSWTETLGGSSRIHIPDGKISFLYNAAVRTLILHSPRDVYPGPYTYKRFWFRDAAFLINGLLSCGFLRQAERALDQFAYRQTPTGYFLSQEGEWDSNGEAIWIYARYCRLTGRKPKPEWLKAIKSGARWIIRKRLSEKEVSPHAGLLPAGFSAEHLGPNDYYYWDDFWGVAGLRAAADLMDEAGDESGAVFRREAGRFAAAIERSVEGTRSYANRGAIPASPYRRMDAGAVGSIVVDYPLMLWGPGDRRVMATTDFLRENCCVKGAFFQDMIHSGLNAYLTLHMAQVYLRAGRTGDALELIRTVAGIASPTGQWPEAIHPRTEGGCMGDGQHAWAAAEWVLAIRNLFVREEGDGLVIGSGIDRAWLKAGEPVRFGPTPTPHGAVSVEVLAETDGAVRLSWEADWREGCEPDCLEVAVPGVEKVRVSRDERFVTVRPESGGNSP